MILVLAGYDASSGGEAVGLPAEWPNSGTFHSSWPGCANWDYLSVQAAGRKFFKFTCMADNMDRRHDYSKSADATAKRQAQFGTACHELGHDLGLMDLYDVNSVNEGATPLRYNVGYLATMANGVDGYSQSSAEAGSCPTHHDPYSKIYLGFYAPTIINSSGSFSVYKATAPNRYKIYKVKTGDPNVYYLVENRQLESFDGGLYAEWSGDAGGIVLWRVDQSVVDQTWENNEVNTMEGRYGILPPYLGTFEQNGYHYDYPFLHTTKLWGYENTPSITVREGSKFVTFQTEDARQDSMTISVTYADVPREGNNGGMRIDTNTTAAYPLMSGTGGERLPDGSLRFGFDAPYEKQTGVSVDMKPLQRGVDYDVTKGSTIITLKPAFLSTLPDGAHTLTVYFTDGQAQTSFTTPLSGVVTAAVPDVPATGGAQIVTLCCLIFFALLAMAARKRDAR